MTFYSYEWPYAGSPVTLPATGTGTASFQWISPAAPVAQRGWQCPECEEVLAPWIASHKCGDAPEPVVPLRDIGELLYKAALEYRVSGEAPAADDNRTDEDRNT